MDEHAITIVALGVLTWVKIWQRVHWLKHDGWW